MEKEIHQATGQMNKTENIIAVLRKKYGISQQQLASQAGVHVQTVKKLETGERTIPTMTLKTAVAIARALEVSAEVLLDGTVPERFQEPTKADKRYRAHEKELQCVACGKLFIGYRNRQYCDECATRKRQKNRNCRNSNRKSRRMATCVWCGKVFDGGGSRKKTCSSECEQKHHEKRVRDYFNKQLE